MNDNEPILPDSVRMLPRRVRPFPDEPVNSVLYRLALANGYSSVADLKLGIPGFRQIPEVSCKGRRIDIALAARLTGHPEDQLAAETPYKQGNSIILRGHQFGMYAGGFRTKVCPCCLAENKQRGGRGGLSVYRRNWWSVPNITVCPIHLVRLIERCPKCQQGLHPNGSPSTCPSDRQCDVTDYTPKRVDQDAACHDKWLLGRLGIVPPVANYFLDTLPIDTASKLCALAGSIEIGEVVGLRRLTDTRRYNRANKNFGWLEVKGWPEYLPDFLQRAVRGSYAMQGFGSRRPAFYQAFRDFILHHKLDDRQFIIEKMRYQISIANGDVCLQTAA